MQAPDLLAYVLLFLQGAIFGSSFFVIKIALEDFGPITVAAGRIGLGALMLVAYAVLNGERFPRQPKALMWLAEIRRCYLSVICYCESRLAFIYQCQSYLLFNCVQLCSADQ
jgi:drug/metabolite transporter (DMT)-like permease